MDYTIKSVCKDLNMTVHTVRHYCNMGLVPNLCHDKNGNRIFDEESINWLKCVSFLRASGLSIQEIKHYFTLCLEGKSSINERYEILCNLKERTAKDLEFAQLRMKCITEKVSHYQDIISGKCDDDLNPLNW
jgi:DNA-binding transcriptional MerR regulator